MVTEKDLNNFGKSQELKQLEKILNEPNIFNILKIEKRETLHSNFLAWLLNPKESHGLKDKFLKKILNEFYKKDQYYGMDLSKNIEVTTEHVIDDGRIDILIKDLKNKKIVLIENKIETKEHDEQLTRYKNWVEKNFSKTDYKEYVLVYLTLYGDSPKTETTYIPFSYKKIVEILKSMSKGRPYIEEYYKMLERRYFMKDSDIYALSNKINNEHKKALDFIELNIRNNRIYNEIIEKLIEENENLLLLDKPKNKNYEKNYVQFIPKKLDQIIPKKGKENGDSGFKSEKKRIILFQFGINSPNWENQIYFSLMLGPGDSELREKIYTLIQKEDLFERDVNDWERAKRDNGNYSLHTEFTMENLTDLTLGELEKELRQKFNKFIEEKLGKMIKIFEKEFKEKN
jgi:hypothetical protein